MLPLVGSIEAVFAHITPVVIHGDRYLDVVIDHAEGRDVARVPLHAFARHPEIGGRVRLKILLGQVDSVELLT
ncbi:MAG: hypothetical protein SGJ09_02110 [Phycisphaerae bacterium]|nr:hypothetical protein [Phycisphaerae bacterium]